MRCTVLMRYIRFVASGVLVLALAVAAPAVAAPPAGELKLVYGGELLTTGVVADSSGNDLHGTIVTGGGAAITSIRESDGNSFLRFPAGQCYVVPCRQAIIQPIAPVSLVPADTGAGRFVFGADIRLTEEPPTAAGMNVFQFGAAGAGISQWKLQVDTGRPSCRWSDGTEAVLLPAGDADFRLSVGRWYRVSCVRLSPVLFRIRVQDPVTGAQVAGGQAVGSLNAILPSGVVVIGGKRVRATQTDVDTDQFHGDLDAVVFGRRELPSDG